MHVYPVCRIEGTELVRTALQLFNLGFMNCLCLDRAAHVIDALLSRQRRLNQARYAELYSQELHILLESPIPHHSSLGAGWWGTYLRTNSYQIELIDAASW